MEFDNVFDFEATNEQVFETCTKPIVLNVMDGFNCSVFVYGATGAGKTFTMLGSENNPGKKIQNSSVTELIGILSYFRNNFPHNA